MAKVNYATDTNVALLLTGIADDVSANLAAYSLTISDNWVNSLIDPVSVTATPALVMQAAEYYAAAFTLRNVYDVSEGDSVTAIWYEKTARELLNSYVAQNTDEDSEVHPYSSSLSPSDIFTTRNVRTVEDPLDGMHDDVEDEFDNQR